MTVEMPIKQTYLLRLFWEVKTKLFPDGCPHLYLCKLKHNISAALSSGLPQVSLVYLGIEMIQPRKSFWKFDCWRRIQRTKRCVSTNNNKDEDNSPKNHNQNNTNQDSSPKIQTVLFSLLYFFFKLLLLDTNLFFFFI